MYLVLVTERGTLLMPIQRGALLSRHFFRDIVFEVHTGQGNSHILNQRGDNGDGASQS